MINILLLHSVEHSRRLSCLHSIDHRERRRRCPTRCCSGAFSGISEADAVAGRVEAMDELWHLLDGQQALRCHVVSLHVLRAPAPESIFTVRREFVLLPVITSEPPLAPEPLQGVVGAVAFVKGERVLALFCCHGKGCRPPRYNLGMGL